MQPEVWSLGVFNIKRVCGITEAVEALVACHTAHSLLGTVVNAHVSCIDCEFLDSGEF